MGDKSEKTIAWLLVLKLILRLSRDIPDRLPHPVNGTCDEATWTYATSLDDIQAQDGQHPLPVVAYPCL
jgi:hypothetical protein